MVITSRKWTCRRHEPPMGVMPIAIIMIGTLPETGSPCGVVTVISTGENIVMAAGRMTFVN